jgi:hypothetical protein
MIDLTPRVVPSHGDESYYTLHVESIICKDSDAHEWQWQHNFVRVLLSITGCSSWKS